MQGVYGRAEGGGQRGKHWKLHVKAEGGARPSGKWLHGRASGGSGWQKAGARRGGVLPTGTKDNIFSAELIGLVCNPGQKGLQTGVKDAFSRSESKPWGLGYGGTSLTRCSQKGISLSSYRYDVIKMPSTFEKDKDGKPFIGKSKKGVYAGIIHEAHLRVWILNESCRVLTYEHNLSPYNKYLSSLHGNDMRTYGPWTLEQDSSDVYGTEETLQKQKNFDWDSDREDFFTVEGSEDCYAYFHITGFHPYKEVAFIRENYLVLAYHLDSSKIQYLGSSCPNCYCRGTYEGFLYTPCMIGELYEDKSTCQRSS
uniref:F-box associated domain-containing protein n=1 Tax=Leersia perrieri TaxID=77586 RepID=A0A0D9XR07_9ORYZ